MLKTTDSENDRRHIRPIALMKILLSNDDGYLAPGLIHLVEGLSPMAEVTVIAPDRNQSGVSNAMTFHRPLHVARAENGFIHVDGTPVDCIHLAITGLLREKWDVVLSGINAGRNLGDDVWYSGTLGAAMEARSLGVPAMAVSLVGEDPTHFETAARAVRALLARMDEPVLSENTLSENVLSDRALPNDMILNVNVPDIPWPDVRGFEVTRLGRRGKPMDMITATDPNGRPVHWIGPAGEGEDAGPGTDFFAIGHNKISVTPIQVDLTRHAALAPVAGWIQGIHES
uniref:5'-nucleotidase SurE n=1 Tax=Candidatus Kentrum eta TaxID=2126337 RepID=A0A450U5M0_9GAMM|nr:MAG: 5'-nucleotidase /3'-nucleotidase /exopolyphosphatase [Candidatus Kentron sp. H]VFJ88305.1 MAG: 5'-nucleotidase /3'-nucleotidase /exopolyphosphatase [Candidatus Kentron sp. H]VFJ95526.1 MAG: 5'-nucleotidase /3'-nucleotidase /exopolyphosphatase [Candidatus Kentron sp. H]